MTMSSHALKFLRDQYLSVLRRCRRHEQLAGRPPRRLPVPAVVECLEPRLLLSAVTVSQADAIRTGLDAVATFGGRLDETPEISVSIPLLSNGASASQATGGSAVGSMPVTIADLLDAHDIFRQALADPIAAYLAAEPNPTTQGIIGALVDFSAGDLTVDYETLTDRQVGSTLELDIALAATRIVTAEFDLGAGFDGSAMTFDSVLSVPVTLDMHFDATLVVTSVGASGPDEFTVSFGPNNSIGVFIDEDPLPFGGQIGSLGLSIEGATMDLDAEVAFVGIGSATVGELTSAPLTDFLTVSTDVDHRSFMLEMPLDAQFEAFDLSDGSGATAVVTDANLFDGEFDLASPFFELRNAEDLLDFRNVSAVALFEAIDGLQGVFRSVVDSDVFQKEIPFTNGKTLAELLNVEEAFDAALLGNLSDDGESGSINYNTVQDFVNTIANAFTYVEDLDGDASTHDPTLLMKIDFNHLFEVATFDLDLGLDLGDLNNFGVGADTQISVEAELGAAFELGITFARVEGGLPLDAHTKLADLNGGSGVTAQSGQTDLQFTLRSGLTFDVDLQIGMDSTIGNLITRVQGAADAALTAANDAPELPNYGGMFRVLINDDQDALEFRDTTYEKGLFGFPIVPEVTFGIITLNNSMALDHLGLGELKNTDEDKKTSYVGRPINGRFSIDDSTKLSTLNRDGEGVKITDGDDIKFTLSNGVTFNVDLFETIAFGTLAEVSGQFVKFASETDLSKVEVGDTLKLTDESDTEFTATVSEVDNDADKIKVEASPGNVNGKVKWVVERNSNTVISGGEKASITKDSTTVTLTNADVSNIMVGDVITLDGQTGGGEMADSDKFTITAIDTNAKTITVDKAPTGATGEHEWTIIRELTIGLVKSAIHNAAKTAGLVVPEAGVDDSTVKFKAGVNDDLTGLLIEDKTGGSGDFKVESQNSSLAALGLGIAGTGEDGKLQGTPLHGKSLFDSVFVRGIHDTVALGTLAEVDGKAIQFAADTDLSDVEAGDTLTLTEGDGTEHVVTIKKVDDGQDDVEIGAADEATLAGVTETLSWVVSRPAPMLDGTARLIADNIKASANFGFVDLSIGQNATASGVGQLNAQFSIGDIGTDKLDDRVTLNEAYDAFAESATKITALDEVVLDEIAKGNSATITKDNKTIELGQSADLSKVALGDTIILMGRTDGRDGTDEFEIEAIDDDNKTVTVTSAPTGSSGMVAWSIKSAGYGGVLKFTIKEINGSETESKFAIPFYVPAFFGDPAAQETDGVEQEMTDEEKEEQEQKRIDRFMRIVVSELNLAFKLVNHFNASTTGEEAQDPRIEIGSSGKKLTFKLTDGTARLVTVAAGTKEDLRKALNFEDSNVNKLFDTLKLIPGMPDDLIFDKLPDDAESENAAAKLGLVKVKDSDGTKAFPTAYLAIPKFDGSANFNLPFDVNLAGLNLPALPEINIGLPDLSVPDLGRLLAFDMDLTALTNALSLDGLSITDFELPDPFNLDLGPLGDLFSLRDLSFSDIIDGVRLGLDYLRNLDGIELAFLNADIPLIGVNLDEILDIAAVFADLVDQFEANPAAAIGQIEDILEGLLAFSDVPGFPVFPIPELNVGLSFNGIDLSDPFAYLQSPLPDLPDLPSYLKSLQLPSPLVDLSLDISGEGENKEVAVRIDFELPLGTVTTQVPVNLDLDSLDVAELSNLIDASATALLDVSAGATIELSVGIDLTHEDGIQSFLYDLEEVQPGQFEGSRVEFQFGASTVEPLEFMAAVGPLGLEVTNGTLTLSGTTIATGSEATITQNTDVIPLDAGADLSNVQVGHFIELTGRTDGIDGSAVFEIKEVDDAADTVTVAGEPTDAGATVAWIIAASRGAILSVGLEDDDANGRHYVEELIATTKAMGDTATVVQNTTAIQLDTDADLSDVEVGQVIELTGRTDGIDEGAKFEIIAFDDGDNTVTVAPAPSSPGGTVEWRIKTKGLELNDIDLQASGEGDISLDIEFPGLPVDPGNVSVSIADLNKLIPDTLDLSTVTVTGGGIFDLALAAFSGNFSLLAMVGGWEGAFDLLIEAMEGEVFGVDIPLIGDALKDQATFLRDIKQAVADNFNEDTDAIATDSNPLTVQNALFDALGPGGINLLQDQNGDGGITIDDVVAGVDPDPAVIGFFFDLHLAQDLLSLELPINFDLGVPGLNLEIDAPVSAMLGFDLRLTMGMNTRDGFYIDTTNVDELEVMLDVSIPGLSAEGNLGFLRVNADDLPTPQATIGIDGPLASQFIITAKEAGDLYDGIVVSFIDDGSVATANQDETVVFDEAGGTLIFRISDEQTTARALMDLVNDDSAVSQHFMADLPFGFNGDGVVNDTTSATMAATLPSGFRGRFNIDLVDPDGNANDLDGDRLVMAELFTIDSFNEIIDFTVGGTADVNLHLLASFGGGANFPSIRADFGLDWEYELGAGFVLPTVGFSDVELNIGEFFDGFAAGTLGQVKDVLKPIQPILDALQQAVPVISELAGEDITFIDLARLYNGSINIAGFLDGLITISNLVNAIPDLGSSSWINLGGFSYDLELEEIVFDDNGLIGAIKQQIEDATPPNFDISTYFDDPKEKEDDELKISFPIISDPSKVFGLLIGQTVDLFTLELPKFEFDFTMSKFFPVPSIPVLGVEIVGSVGAEIDLAFGYDSKGLSEYLMTGDLTDVFNGLFLFDHENADGSGEDISELTLKASLEAKAKLEAGVASASIGGGLFAKVEFDLNDPNDDGKIRMVEFLDNFLLGDLPFVGIHIFDISGDLTAGIKAEVTVGGDDLGLTKEFEIATITLFDFNIDRPDGNALPLAQKVGSTLELNVGANAHRRFNAVIDAFDPELDEDIAETYVILPGGSADSVRISAFGREQTYTGISRITGDFGEGDDSLTVHEFVTVDVEVSGGVGNDILIGGAGNDALDGGQGNDEIQGRDGDDTLTGGMGDDDLRGEDGNDRIFGNEGVDAIDGGDGDDIIAGGDARDTIEGGSGADEIHGDGGNDLITGGLGSDTLYGDDGDDQVEGGKDGDTIYGGAGVDILLGDDGADEIHGGEGQDFAFGGVGNDTIFGDEGNDQLFGENSRDTIYGGAGNDLILGGLAGDNLFGGPDDDTIYATDDQGTEDPAEHEIHGGGGADILYGDIADDVIFGDGENDETGAADASLEGDDVIHGLAGNDQVFAGGGNDTVFGDAGDDYIAGELGDDELHGNDGRDALFGGVAVGTAADFDSADASLFENPALDPREDPSHASETTHTIVPVVLQGATVDGVPADGEDLLLGEAGDDWLFGGSGQDRIFGDVGQDYIDAGAGNDLVVSGGDGDDVVRGGGNDDIVHGDAGADLVYGDGGSDQVFGDDVPGADSHRQRLFGGSGIDSLYAFASETDADGVGLPGNELYGGADNDFLYGNMRDELLIGGTGNDFIHGDYLNGPTLVVNTSADTVGGNDTIFGDSGEDKLFGGGGNDEMWGGADSDILEGQRGSDIQYGGSGIDLFMLPTNLGVAGELDDGQDIIDGHFGNLTPGDIADDNATDIVMAPGTSGNDVILISQTKDEIPRVRIDYNNDNTDSALTDKTLFVDAIEQVQVAGLGGDDFIGFVDANTVLPSGFLSPVVAGVADEFNATTLAATSSDFVGVFDGNSGDDTLIGSDARDRLDGGRGNDVLFGFGGDDRLWGDSGEGSINDHDVLFAGQGNDDLLGGQGSNDLLAWSMAPELGLFDTPDGVANLIANGPSVDFGVFVDQEGNLFSNDDGGQFVLEDTGLNRIIGMDRDDDLFGGTGLDFMFGGAGDNVLFRRDGTTFESLDGGLAGDEWKEYAKQTDAVWYVAATNAADEIRVDFVTEPGLLADHHLVTRLTENNGQFSFAAQVRLDFDATDSEGNRLWDANDIVLDANTRLAALDALGGNLNDQERADVLDQVDTATTQLVNNLLPPEGDFLAIIIDALGGNDLITVGPTVQKTVWIDAGAGDDVVNIRGGNPILVDKAESVTPDNGLRGRNDDPEHAFELALTAAGGEFNGLTVDNPDDADWFSFTGLPRFSDPVVMREPLPCLSFRCQAA